ncbi:hypothetical protein [Stakelama tenebrarum]|uniref:STAS/SEC14 domain-containing protein n=1 Tax=Stakelama tenebrarum TaxID=2711215 RepID=A0A6G6Y2J9_9SPHN|nr:hypothetical protein [Sphingosinithalassobacter tenebrarum]QIG79174.1 hypothetical protein G5C33_04800 [Sphingosinithalassobacter tenebrarum]
MFDIAYDAPANIVRINVRGFWSPELVSQFARAVGQTFQRAHTIRDDFDILVDSTDFPVQAHDVADLLAEVMQGSMPLTSGRSAVVVGSHLNRLQAERTLIHPRVKVFAALEAAQDWLKTMA